jgi:hypothetical protein
MEIGKPQRIIRVEPLRAPPGTREPEKTAPARPAEPKPVPAR